MANAANDVQKLYLAYFGRPADPGGLAYWMAATGSLAALNSAFAGSAEFQTAYRGKPSTAIIESLYQHLFDRAPEWAGLQYWSALLDQGTLGVADIVPALLQGAQGGDAALIANRVAFSSAFTARFADLPNADWQFQINLSSGNARAGMGMVTRQMSAQAISKLVDLTGDTSAPSVHLVNASAAGYLQGAGYYGKSSSASNEYGNFIDSDSGPTFSLVPFPDPDYYFGGGVDSMTGLSYLGILHVGAKAEGASPLASLFEELEALGLSKAQANARIASAFDLAGFDAEGISPFDLALAAAASERPSGSGPAAAATPQAALGLQAASVGLDSVHISLTKALQALAGGEAGLDTLAASKAAAAAIAQGVAAGTFDLDDGAALAALLAPAANGTGDAALAARVAGLDATAVSAFAMLLGAGSANIAAGANFTAQGSPYQSLAHIAQAGAVAQNGLAAKLAAALADGSAQSLLADYTGLALLQATGAVKIKDINPYTDDDAAAIAAANGEALIVGVAQPNGAADAFI